MENLKLRFYDITVTASDSAGNIGSDTCKVIIISSCVSSDSNCEEYEVDSDLPWHQHVEGYYYSINAVDESIMQSQVLFKVAEAELVWTSGLHDPIQENVTICDDRVPPEILTHNAEIFRCDEDDTLKLCYTGKVFKKEKQVKNFLEYQFNAIDVCASTSELDMKIQYKNGTCRDTVYTLTPVQDYPACNNTVGFVNPLHGSSKEVTVQLDDGAPVVECGFLPGANSINVIDNKTLYHYMLKTDGVGSRFNDARFFYNVTENCNEDVRINVVVTSNEIEQNKIAQLFKRKRMGVVEQAEFLYAPSRCGCENKGMDGLCKSDPSMEGFKTRYYDITVTASDSAGNAGSDTCKVVIVPSCLSSDPDCAESFYYSISAVNASVVQSQVLYEVAEAELVWTSGLETPNLGEETGEAVAVLDDGAPVIKCGFLPDAKGVNVVDNKTLYHYTLKTDGVGPLFNDARFFFLVTDDNSEDIHIKVIVDSNEVQENDVAKLSKYKMTNSVEQADLFYSASRCEDMGRDFFCKNDHTMQSLKVRFYDITVTATDSAGNTGSDTCKVIIVPSCTNSIAGCEEYNGNSFDSAERMLQSARKLVGCYDTYASGNKYQVGDMISATIAGNSSPKYTRDPDNGLWQMETTTTTTTHNYRCKSDKWCGTLGYGPGEQGEVLAWEKGIECSDDVAPPSSSPTPPLPTPPLPAANANANANYGCPEEFGAGVMYEGGNTVTVDNRVFRCKAWPHSGHCSQAGYKPLTNPATPDAWMDAWDFIGYCNFFQTVDSVNAAVAQSWVHNRVAEADLVWEHGLNFPY